MRIDSYLTFNGNCREAMTFYQKCFGGELVFQSLGDSPLCEKIPEQMKQTVLHATLTSGNFILMASDMVSEKGLLNGSSVSLLLNCSNENEMRKLYKVLAQGGEKTHQIERTFFGDFFGDLTDKFGVQWLLHAPSNAIKLNVEVFKTDITKKSTALKISERIKELLPTAKINFDLDDCDHILRIESNQNSIKVVQQVSKDLHFFAEVLD